MNLLIITNNPDRASFRQRIEVYLDTLRTNDIDCEVAKLPRSSLARRMFFKRAGQFDGVFLQKKCLNLYDATWLRQYSKKIIYDLDDAIMYSPKKPGSDRSSHFRLFRRTAKLADMVIAGNSYLAEHAQRFNTNVKILPTGLDKKVYKVETKPKIDGKIRLVWIGSKSTLCYLMEIKSALEEIGSRLDNVVLRIICDDFFGLQNMEVEKCWWSLEKQAVDLATSDIGLAPLPDDRFTRGKCGFKILQYEAANLPIVTSPVGVNTEYVRNGVTGYHAPNIPQWVDRITELIDNIKLRKQMANAGRAHAERFDTGIIGKKLCSLITECIQGSAISVKQLEHFGDRTEKPARLQKNTVTVSICIPTYNRKDYLKETLDSILAQTYKDYEIVIVDDGSTDGTEDMTANTSYGNLRYHWQQNQGEPTARNKLVELAQGEFITFIDSDDLLFPYALEELLEAVQSEGPDTIAYSSYIGIDEDGAKVKRKQRKLPSGNITADLFEYIHVHSCGIMCTKKLLQEADGFNVSLPVCSPYALWLKLSLKYKFIAVEKPTFKRRRHPGNLSQRSFANCKVELGVLEDFYYNGNGEKMIPQHRAMKRLSKEEYRAGRAAIREGLYDQASQLLGQSFRGHPNLKSLIHWMRAISIVHLR